MIKFNYIRIMLLTAVTASALFLTPVLAYVDLGPEKDLHNYSRTTISTIDSPYEISLQYQIRDAANNLACVVESDKTQYYDSSLTPVYLDNHPSHKIIEKNNQMVHYVLLEDHWRVGPGDTFLSAVKHVFEDNERQRLLSFFFATTNGCSIQIGDTVTSYWKIYYLEH
jgi:hypothetical protein